MKADHANPLIAPNGNGSVTFQYPAGSDLTRFGAGAGEADLFLAGDVMPASRAGTTGIRESGADEWRSTEIDPDISSDRPRVCGRFLFVGKEKLYVRGVTYGTFRPDENGDEFPAPEVVEHDFAMMAANGINAVRTYTPAPRWLLD